MKTLIDTIGTINDEVGRTMFRYGCGLYIDGSPQEITVVGENYEAIDYLNKRIWG